MLDVRDVVMLPGFAVDEETGLLVDDFACWTNWEPIKLCAGSTILGAREGYRYRIVRYSENFDESLVREYSYDAESNWTSLESALPPNEWLEGEYPIPDTCYVRITVQRIGAIVSQGFLTIGEVVKIKSTVPPEAPLPDYFAAEINRVSARVDELREPGDLVLVAVADIHYSTGCIWPETARNIQEVCKRVHPAAIVQLGDISDGLAPLLVTKSFVSRVLCDLKANDLPVFSCVGNHDMNCFRGNTECLTIDESSQLYLGRNDPWYYEDFANEHLRCIFLNSFNPERKDRYGFEKREVRWLARTLRTMPDGWKAMVFSHVPPLPEIHHWSNVIFNGPEAMKVLERFNSRRPGTIMAFVHGHNHADAVYWKQTFPIISIGCAKYEDFIGYKPEGGYTPARQRGDATQDLWDVLVIKAQVGKIHLVRFGAGKDRSANAYAPR